jgi:hypothetical protein
LISEKNGGSFLGLFGNFNIGIRLSLTEVFFPIDYEDFSISGLTHKNGFQKLAVDGPPEP